MAYEVDPPSIVDLSAEHDDLRRRAEGAELQVADLQRCLEDAAAVADDAELRAARLAGELAAARAEVAALGRRVAELTASRGLATPAAAGAAAASRAVVADTPGSSDPDQRRLGRALKRALAEEQNDLLDRACRSRQLPPLDELLPDPAARRRALAAAAAPLGAEPAGELAVLLGDPLGERLAEALAPIRDGDAAADAARAVYREWRERRVAAVLDAVAGRGAGPAVERPSGAR